ncbi:hypothetical protein [Methylobacterium nonmethylotrophicum]|uniref:17 kDa surface antigen n=1 Tax=Methylobacterium nonmethylotrophicum TaxID=1141884 RepID=A0A4Z0NMV2_9HYPH|nr:hypothetical protein [Methylobacterium nonmethylotrophicum]TGD97957.1 hypothetical protein EU555_17500 [Methylobacterium nonmethylotrophicum]
MLKKTLTIAVAALTLSSATLAPTSQAQAGGLGKVIAIGILGTAVGAIAGAASARAQENAERSRGGDEPGFRQVRSDEGGCGFRNSPVFDEDGNRIGFRRVPAC